MHQALNSPGLNLKAGRRKFTLVYMDYFRHVHKTEAGRKIHCWEWFSISWIWICRYTEKVFRNTSANVQASTVHTQSPPELFCAVLQCLDSPKIQCLCLLIGQEASLPHTSCSAAWMLLLYSKLDHFSGKWQLPSLTFHCARKGSQNQCHS